MRTQIDGYTFFRITENRYADLQSILAAAFNQNDPISRFSKKYDTSAFGESHIGYIAIHKETGEPAAYYGVFPIIGIIDGKPTLIAQSGDTMTHPNHGRKGLFTELAKNTFQLAKDKGIQLIFGFPNSHSFPGFQKRLNWTFNHDMMYCNFKAPFPLTNKILSKVGRLNSKIESKFKLLTEVSEFTTPTPTAHFYIPKSKNYVDYKTNFGGKLFKLKDIEILGKIQDESLLIGALRTKNYDPEILKSTFIDLFKFLNVRSIGWFMSSNHPTLTIVSSFMNVDKSLPIGFLPLTNGDLTLSLVVESADFDTF
jgi:hypothetical protein